MFINFLVTLATSLATKLLTLLATWLINVIDTNTANRKIDEALDQDDRTRAAGDLDAAF